MIHLARRGHLWSFSGHYSESLRIACKETPGMVWNAQARAWVGYEDAARLVAARCAKDRVALGDSTRLLSNGHNPPPPMATSFAVSFEDLRDYQRIGVDFLVAHAAEGALLADATGLGKTAQAIRAARAFKEKTVIVCPAFVRGVWEKELARWWPAATATNLRGLKATAVTELANVAILNYEIAHAWVEALATWGAKTLIVDELHYLLSATAKRTRAVGELARGCSYRIGLSATPMTSRPRDLWAPVDILCPGRFGRFYHYAERYCDGHKEQVTPTKAVWKTDGASNLEELNARLRYFMLRRTKSQVSLELPPLTRQVFEIEVGSKYCARPGPALRSDKALRAALDQTAEGKIDQVVEMIVEHLGAEHRVVCFTFRKIIAREIAERVGSKVRAEIGIITGDLDQKKRAAVVASQPALLAATMDSTGVGIDLSFADVAIFAELDWVPSKLEQAEGRLDRFGQKNAVLVQYPIARGSADEIIKSVCLEKLMRSDDVLGKADTKLREDLDGGGMTAVERLRGVYERIMAEEG